MTSSQDKIQQMINFIDSEAKDQANIISVKANEEYAIDKQNLVEAAKIKIRNYYKQKEKDVEVEKQM
jgi:vacuolar-type H+-ATPase subunit E/Vma4